MAKFKVGDKVTDGNSVFQITKVNPDDYDWKLVKGDGKDAFGKIISEGGMISWADLKMRKASNSVTSKNPIVQNALEATVRNVKAYDGYGRSIKVGDEVDTNKGLARVVQIKNRNDGSIHGVASYIGLSYKPNSNAVDEWIRCRTDGSAHGVKVQNSVVANAIKACNGNNWTMADAKEWASSLSVIADKDYNDDWLKEGLDSFKRYGKQFANLVGPSEAKKVEDAIRKGRAKDLPRLIGSMKPYKANGSLVNAVATNGERTPASIIKLDGKAGDLYLKVTETLREYVSSLTSLNAECARLKDNEFLRKDELRVAKESLANITRVNY